ncbi:MAG: T9SS type A sorting domain-containing protein [Ignavibacteria bacterium]|nr:T9SS type A sorting domain-containing protein [Ignavibacteria bacterium]
MKLNIIVCANDEYILLFLNSHGSFLQDVSYYLLHEDYENGFFPFVGSKLEAVDLHNQGGISIIFSGFPAVLNSDPLEQLYDREDMFRFNASTIDAVPAPAYIFESNVQENDSIYHPQLLLFNRGDRDFMKYRIYKRNYVSYLYNLFDSTESDHYIDTTEDLLYMNVDPEDPIPDNLFYYAVAVDNSYKVSVTSDTISYPAYVCPTCEGAIGPDNFAVSNVGNILPKEYSLSNYPNPFNPSTKIKYTLPKEGIVKITIYNLLGQRVTELVNESKQPGAYIAEFNAHLTEQGVYLSSGIYFYQLESSGIVLTRRMLLIK